MPNLSSLAQVAPPWAPWVIQELEVLDLAGEVSDSIAHLEQAEAIGLLVRYGKRSGQRYASALLDAEVEAAGVRALYEMGPELLTGVEDEALLLVEHAARMIHAAEHGSAWSAPRAVAMAADLRRRAECLFAALELVPELTGHDVRPVDLAEFDQYAARVIVLWSEGAKKHSDHAPELLFEARIRGEWWGLGEVDNA